MRCRDIALAALIFCCAVIPARAAPLLLEVWRNGAATGMVLPVTRDGAALLIPASDFAALSINVTAPPSETVDLTKLPGVSATIDEANQRLMLVAAPAALPRQLYDLGAAPAVTPAISETGAILRYDLSATLADAARAGRTLTGGAGLELDLFGGNRRFLANGFASFGALGRAVRLDTALTLDRPETLTHLTIGDAISVAPAHARAVRFAGLQYATDFSLAPGLVTMPLPSFFGESEVPATVEVYSGAARLAQQDVAPGPFELRNLPILTGGGAATVVVRDVLGRESTQTFSLFLDKAMLAPGREAFAFDAGFRRAGYGLRSFDYRDPMLSADWRGGFDVGLTLEAHGEAAPRLALLGGGAALGLGPGFIAAHLAASSSGDGTGLMAALSARLNLGRINLFGAGQAGNGAFRDLASLDGFAPPRWRLQAGATADLKNAGVLAFSWIGEKRPGRQAQSLLNASWSLALPGGLSFAATALYDFATRDAGAQIALAMPVGARGLASLSAASDAGGTVVQALYDNPADPDGGLGYRLGLGSARSARLQAEARYVGEQFGAGGGVAVADGHAALRADIGGALIALRGGLFATRDPGEAVALVETGAPGIRIYRENRPVAVSDAEGRALLTGLAALAPNHIAVEPLDYPFDTVVETAAMTVAPPRRGAALVDLAPPRRRPLLAMVSRGGLSLPAGARVIFDGEAEAQALGHDGRLFIADLKAPRGAVIEAGKERCRIFLTPEEARGLSEAPALTCFREPDLAY